MNECRDPPSTIDQCTDDRHLLFKFRACIDIHGSESKGIMIVNVVSISESNF